MTKEPHRGESRFHERLQEEAGGRTTLLAWLESEILLIRSQIERINSQHCRPPTIAAGRTKKEIQASQLKHAYCCWICGNEVDLKNCNIDECGMAVHEDCYFVRVAFATESMRLTTRKPAHRIRCVVVADGAPRKTDLPVDDKLR